jgi:hypothetical protein
MKKQIRRERVNHAAPCAGFDVALNNRHASGQKKNSDGSRRKPGQK